MFMKKLLFIFLTWACALSKGVAMECVVENYTLEGNISGILSLELAAFKKEVSELAAEQLAPLEVEFLRAFPQALDQELFLCSSSSFFKKGYENVEWELVEESVKSSIKQFYLADLSVFGEALIQPLLNDIYFHVTIKDESQQLLGFALFSITPSLPKGTVKVINLVSVNADTRSLLLNSIFKMAPETDRLFIYIRPTSENLIKEFLSWGFSKKDNPPIDPNHKINHDYLLYLEYNVLQDIAKEKYG